MPLNSHTMQSILCKETNNLLVFVSFCILGNVHTDFLGAPQKKSLVIEIAGSPKAAGLSRFSTFHHLNHFVIPGTWMVSYNSKLLVRFSAAASNLWRCPLEKIFQSQRSSWLVGNPMERALSLRPYWVRLWQTAIALVHLYSRNHITRRFLAVGFSKNLLFQLWFYCDL